MQWYINIFTPWGSLKTTFVCVCTNRNLRKTESKKNKLENQLNSVGAKVNELKEKYIAIHQFYFVFPSLFSSFCLVLHLYRKINFLNAFQDGLLVLALALNWVILCMQKKAEIFMLDVFAWWSMLTFSSGFSFIRQRQLSWRLSWLKLRTQLLQLSSSYLSWMENTCAGTRRLVWVWVVSFNLSLLLYTLSVRPTILYKNNRMCAKGKDTNIGTYPAVLLSVSVFLQVLFASFLCLNSNTQTHCLSCVWAS